MQKSICETLVKSDETAAPTEKAGAAALVSKFCFCQKVRPAKPVDVIIVEPDDTVLSSKTSIVQLSQHIKGACIGSLFHISLSRFPLLRYTLRLSL